MARICGLLLLAGAASVSADPPSDPLPGVFELTSENFDETVKNGKFWLIEFYAPYCGHCKTLAKDWGKLGKAVGDSHKTLQIAKYDVAQDDEDDDDSPKHTYSVQALPGIVLIKPDGSHLVYEGRNSFASLKDFITSKTSVPFTKDGAGDVIEVTPVVGEELELTKKTWRKIVKDKTKNVMVKFYAPWCGACKELQPIWTELAEENTDEDLIFANINCEDFGDMCYHRFEVRGYPTVRMYSKTDKTGSRQYNGGRFKDKYIPFIDENKDA
ncbi:putative protein disulfide-isomerase A6 [Diplonema papillatum]|nr:putative protein disulfide-isomerase A6 [Diplonema papillatum]